MDRAVGTTPTYFVVREEPDEGNNGAGIEIVAWTLIAEPGATVAGTPEGRLVSGSLVPVIQIEASPRL